jgi:hypothetical protein
MIITGAFIRGTKLTGTSTASVATDEYFNLVSMLLPGNGINGAQNNTFLDSSTNNLSITRNGNPTQGTFSPFSQTGWSNYFDGSGDYLTVADNAAFEFGSGDFTIECWVYNTGTNGFIVSQQDNSTAPGSSFILFISSGALVGLVYYNGGSVGNITDPTSFPLNQWVHIALVRSSNTITLYLNGTSKGTFNISSGTLNNSSQTLAIGARNNGGDPLTGYISNLRIVKGTAVYTSNFTPSTSPLTAISNTQLLTCQSNRFIDNSTNAFAITVNGNTAVQAFAPFDPTTSYSTSTVGGSGYFDGSGDWLTVINPVLNYGTSNFSLEFWVYPTTQGPATYWWSDGSSDSLGYYSDAADQWRVYLGTSAASYNIFLGNNLTGTRRYQWNHIVLCRNGTTVSIFVNGTRVATNGSVSGSMTLTNNTYQLMSLSSSAAAGYMFGFRTVIGSYVYDATQTSITLPTAPPTAVSNTKFLCNFTNGGITDAAAKNVLETVGGAAISTTQSKFGGSSMAFDGSGDYLIFPSPQTQNFVYGTGNFTIEFWFYMSALAGSGNFYVLYDGRPASTTGAYVNLAINNATPESYVNGATVISGSPLSANTWYHFAYARSGSSTKMFINGIQVGSTYTDNTNYINAANRPVIGTNGFTLGNSNFNGYIDDLRITKGLARYTANFTPPTQAFPTQ